MALRNFWLTADIDGRETTLIGGPQSKDGGMDVTLRVRKDGESVEAFTICCRADGANLRIYVRDANGQQIGYWSSRR